MKIQFVNPNARSTGDSKYAKGHYTRGLYFESLREAYDLLDELKEAFPIDTSKKAPGFYIHVNYKPRRTTRKMGHADYYTGEILMYRPGFRVSTLIHEYAHLMPNGNNHGAGFKANQTKLIMWYDRMHKSEPTAPKIVKFAFGQKKIEKKAKVFLKAADNNINKQEFTIDKYKTRSGFNTTRWSLK